MLVIALLTKPPTCEAARPAAEANKGRDVFNILPIPLFFIALPSISGIILAILSAEVAKSPAPKNPFSNVPINAGLLLPKAALKISLKAPPLLPVTFCFLRKSSTNVIAKFFK